MQWTLTIRDSMSEDYPEDRLNIKNANRLMLVKSKGHLFFTKTEDEEFYVRGNHVYRASLFNTLDSEGYRNGRPECSVAHMKTYAETYMWTGYSKQEIIQKLISEYYNQEKLAGRV